MMAKYIICDSCGLVHEAEKVNVGVGMVAHYHCPTEGYAHEASVEDLFDDAAEALSIAALEWEGPK